MASLLSCELIRPPAHQVASLLLSLYELAHLLSHEVASLLLEANGLYRAGGIRLQVDMAAHIAAMPLTRHLWRQSESHSGEPISHLQVHFECQQQKSPRHNPLTLSQKSPRHNPLFTLSPATQYRLA